MAGTNQPRSAQDTPTLEESCLHPRTANLSAKTYGGSRVEYSLSDAIAFSAVVRATGGAELSIEVDGISKWQSGALDENSEPKSVHVDLYGAITLTLVTLGSPRAEAQWTDAAVTYYGSEPCLTAELDAINIETANAALRLLVASDGKLYQRGFGAKTASETRTHVAYPTAGDGWVFEPALRVIHADGNTSTDLRVWSWDQQGNLTRIALKDCVYDLYVLLCFRASTQEDVIESWVEVENAEAGPVRLERFASAAPTFGSGEFHLTQFAGDWAREMTMHQEPLGLGTKVIESKLGVRSHQFQNPSFLLSKGEPTTEDSGEVFGGSLAWSGSFQFAFERMPNGQLHALCGMNPYGSAYELASGDVFSAPRMVWGWSAKGASQLSQNLHQWARRHAVRDADRPRAILLNNWEATCFDFDAKKVISLFDGAKELGFELFLLDDGWFGNKFARNSDTQGLGDWEPNQSKLPEGLSELTEAAAKKGLRFGIWLEPEMVNPGSELFEKHPDWVVKQPYRRLALQRNQLVLDLSNPEVEEFVYTVINRCLTDNPGISFVKWDCNRYFTQPGSPYLGKDKQSHLQVDYTLALNRILERFASEHPDVELMLCAGGGGRVDYGSLQFGHEFWPSDMTDPCKRIFIQWGYSYFMPAIATANHVTRWGNRPLKFSFDVAMSGRLGMDVDVDKLSDEEREFARSAIATYKGLRDIVQLGDLFRLESPYAGTRTALMYARNDQAALFVYSLEESPAGPVRLKGLDPHKQYSVTEQNLGADKQGSETVHSGKTLIEDGLPLPALGLYGSGVFTLREV